MPKIRNIETLPLDGGILCFHFINTVYAWRGENLHEYLNSYEELIRWCKKVNILNAVQRTYLSGFANLHPVKAIKALQELKNTREVLYHFFSAIAANNYQKISVNVLSQFNTVLTDSFRHLQFGINRKRLQLEWNNSENNLLEPLWIIVKSAYDILTTQDRSRIKECPKCGWIFIDKTKNNKRRWCNPAFCGSTDKSKRYYQKIRKAQILQPVKEKS